MASSAFSFHCMICFEEFDPDTNYPVVLPCGHTYVCAACANRLDKCPECRAPLTVQCETAPPPPPPGGLPGTPGRPSTPSRNGAAAATVAAGPDMREESTSGTDRVRNSPGFRRRYGHRDEYSHNASAPPPPPVVTQRLPLPKNVVLLSLIQASEPTRWTVEGDAPRTPQSRSSPLLRDGSRNGEPDGTSMPNLVGSMPDDEERKICVGTYLEGGPCGTYAVATKDGLLVYPTLFEHTLPSALSGLRQAEDTMKRDVEELVEKHRASAGMASVASEEVEDEIHGLTASLTASDDDGEVEGGRISIMDTSTRTLPARRTHSIQGVAALRGMPPEQDVPGSCSLQPRINKQFSRHFSQGAYPTSSEKKNKDMRKNETAVVDEFDRPLIRLNYGDRVQIVSMDTRGWVKLARGYGYVRLENDKQLVKVGGTSDKACQIEAMLHELSLERDRLKREQTILERRSAGLMTDLQSSLLTSDDDQVVVSAPMGSLRRSDSESNLSFNYSVSVDDIDVSNRSRTGLQPRSTSGCKRGPAQPADHAHREIRPSLSHSPTRMANPPRSPSHPQITGTLHRTWSNGQSPMRVNFRTGMSGHRALTSSHSHPHDFIAHHRGHRAMSNHSGIPTTAHDVPSSFWESPCTGIV